MFTIDEDRKTTQEIDLTVNKHFIRESSNKLLSCKLPIRGTAKAHKVQYFQIENNPTILSNVSPSCFIFFTTVRFNFLGFSFIYPKHSMDRHSSKTYPWSKPQTSPICTYMRRATPCNLKKIDVKEVVANQLNFIRCMTRDEGL